MNPKKKAKIKKGEQNPKAGHIAIIKLKYFNK